jgi:hypothetical protein
MMIVGGPGAGVPFAVVVIPVTIPGQEVQVDLAIHGVVGVVMGLAVVVGEETGE